VCVSLSHSVCVCVSHCAGLSLRVCVPVSVFPSNLESVCVCVSVSVSLSPYVCVYLTVLVYLSVCVSLSQYVSLCVCVCVCVSLSQAVINYANGGVEGEIGFYLGTDSSPFEVATGVNMQLPDIFIRNCELALLGGAFGSETILNDIFEKSTIEEGNITVVLV